MKVARKNNSKKVGSSVASKKVTGKKTGGPSITKAGNKANIKTPKNQNSSQKVAKSVGAGNAKRAALTNQVIL